MTHKIHTTSIPMQATLPLLLDEGSPANALDTEGAQRALDELFNLAHQYKSSQAYFELLQFIAQFHFYSPFNAMLVHIQMPGATYVASPHHWGHDYQRRIKAGAHPLVILQPMGPVMFVFDVSDTEPEKGAPPLPPEVEHPFETRQGHIGNELQRTVENAKRDGIQIAEQKAGASRAGSIESAQPGKFLEILVKSKPKPEVYAQVPLRYILLLNSDHSAEAKYATLTHELAHLYCGHLGTPNDKWWPDRRGLSKAIREMEAESVSYLLCGRLGIDNPSEEYLAHYLEQNKETPHISLDCVVKVAGLIQQMGREHLKPRKTEK